MKFPMFSKVEVNGEKAAPLYKYLTSLETPACQERQDLLELREVRRRQEWPSHCPLCPADRPGC